MIPSLTGASSGLVAGFIGRLRPLPRQVLLSPLRRIRGPVNTVTIRGPVRAFKVTIKHAGRPFIVTTFALFAGAVAADRRRLDVQGAALWVLVHEGAHGGGDRALVLGAAARRHRVGRAVLGRRWREREDVVRLGGRGARRLGLVGVRAAEGDPGPRVRQRLGPVGQPRMEGRVEVGSTHLA